MANSYFRFRLLLGVICGTITLSTLGIGGWYLWDQYDTYRMFTPEAIIAVMLGASILVINIATYFMIEIVAHDFLVPTMYLYDCSAMEGWRTVNRGIFSGNFWVMVLFYLMKTVLSIASGMVAAMATCLTCCIAALPYIGTVILLPIFVFMRCYTLYFINQFGGDWRLFVTESEWRCPACDYDLRGNPQATHCPECGLPLGSIIDDPDASPSM